MTWVKVDDAFPDHPKVLAAGDLAGWLFVCGLCYCSKHLTDGKIPTNALARLTGLPNPRKLAAALVEQEMWTALDDGWLVVNYEDRQRTRAQVEAERETTAVRVKKHRDKRRGNGVTRGDVTQSELEGDTETNPPGGTGVPPNDDLRSPAQRLTAAYVDEYAHTHGAEPPSKPWRDQAGRQARNLLDADVPYDDVHACLIAAAKENKSPAVLPHLLADLHSERARAAS